MKHLLIGIDGTSQAAFYDKFHSNVFRLNLALNYKDRADHPQFFVYLSGVGSTKKRQFSVLGRAFGQGIDEIILQAYINLVSNYEEGDKIYVFGFSRGAVAARALTGLISVSGLLRAERSYLVEDAWTYFVDQNYKGRYAQIKPLDTHKNLKIEFLGLWDTVYGFNTAKSLRKNPFMSLRFRDFQLDRHVKHGVHVLSMDDSRRYFAPMLWDNGRQPGQKMEQIWMPGVHSDIGGGYQKSFIATVSLFTMLDKLAESCPDLTYDREYLDDHLFKSLEEQEIVINDERENYFLLTDRPWPREIDCAQAARKQSLHPLTAQLEGKDIIIRGKRRTYRPGCKMLNNGKIKLSQTEFASTSYSSQLDKCVTAKFPAP
jgi:uncharacterized protein (DUF2235 family)